MKVCIMGLGYIGFPTACAIAGAGHEVVGVDVNPEIVDCLQSGHLHIVNEDGLAELAQEAFTSGRLHVTSRPEPADAFILAVPTPHRERVGDENMAAREVATTQPALSSHQGQRPADLASERREVASEYIADLRFVEQATNDITPYVRRGNLVILESTVPPQTTDIMVRGIVESRTGLRCGESVFIAHAPERVLPGQILKELVGNDRIVGGSDPKSTSAVAAFYRTFVHGAVVETTSTTAELVKLMENTYRDVNIALANELSLLCERIGVDVREARSMANRHPRVNILSPGPGVGGHCIAVDPYFLIETAPDLTKVIAAARSRNASMPHHIVELVNRISREAGQASKPVEKVVALGASYKPDVADDRESPALEVAKQLRAAGYGVEIHDPLVAAYSATGVRDQLRGADLAIMLTHHSAYRTLLRPEDVIAIMRQPRILDTRQFFGPEWDSAGFHVVRLGVGQERSF